MSAQTVVGIGYSWAMSVTITQAIIDAFALVSKDNQRVHVDPDFAKQTRWGGTIAHGMLSASYMSALLGDEEKLPGEKIFEHFEIDFKAPVRPGDTVRYSAVITEMGERKRMTVLLTAINQDDVVVALASARIIYRPLTA